MRAKTTSFILLLSGLLVSASFPASTQMDEYSIKAGYLYNFTKYVVWPEQTFAASNTPLNICILGGDPFHGKLDQAVAGRTAGDGRVLEVKHLDGKDMSQARQCQVLFIGRSEEQSAAAIVNSLKGASVFAVADFSNFAEIGGVANLRIEGNRVRIDLNMNAAVRANLKVSGKLQQVANIVSN